MTDRDPGGTIRRAAPADAPVMSALGAATFSETFGHLYPPRDLHAFLVGAHSLDAWRSKLADDQTAVWVATTADGIPAGFIAVGACKLPLENRERNAGEIHQLYVLAPYQNLRFGSRLMELGVEWLEARRRAPLYVGVWSQNLGAQRFYQRYGFDKVSEYAFPVGNTLDREFILKR